LRLTILCTFSKRFSSRRAGKQMQASTPTRGGMSAIDTVCGGARPVELKWERAARPGRRMRQERTYNRCEQAVKAELKSERVTRGREEDAASTATRVTASDNSRSVVVKKNHHWLVSAWSSTCWLCFERHSKRRGRC
jgi:hypothetical protein